MLNSLVILSQREQEYLLRVIETARDVRDMRQFFLWTQGQLQALLPHQLMICMQFDGHDALLRIECVHSAMLGTHTLQRLCNRHDGLALRLARHCQTGARLPLAIDLAMQELVPSSCASGASVEADLAQLGYRNLLVHGSGPVGDGSSLFALLDLPLKPGTRQAYFLELLLPYLHMTFLRLSGTQADAVRHGDATARPLSAREAEIMRWVREGKSNVDIGLILGISGLTVKNHLQRIYKTLGVNNRTQAVSRCSSLHRSSPR